MSRSIIAHFDVPGMTAEQYDRIIRDLDAAGAGAPDGRLYHAAGPTEQGWMVVDVWESEEKFGRFAETLMPIAELAGASPPPPRIVPVHNVIEGRQATV